MVVSSPLSALCLWTLVCAATLSAPVTAVEPATRRDDIARLEMEPVTLFRSGGGTVTVYRGTLTVPIVRAKPESKPIAIDVWRFPAAEGADPDAPPVFQLHGGPGWPGMEPGSVDYDREVVPLPLHQDLVIVGQRGIGTSTNMSCDGMLAPSDPDATPEERDDALRNACFTCRE